MNSYQLQLVVYKINSILILLLTQFLLIINAQTCPDEIKKNYIQIIHLLDSQTFKYNKNNKLLICSYNSEFSSKIAEGTDDNIKYFLCLIKHNLSQINLYIINNSSNNYYNYTFELFLSGLGDINFIPYFKGGLKFVITDINIFFIYEINLQNNTANKLSESNSIIPNTKYFQIGNPILNNENQIIFSFIYNKTINLYFYELEGGKTYNISEKCENCLDENEYNSTILSTLTVNKASNIIFSCYEFEGLNGDCFLYKESFISVSIDVNLKCKDSMKNYYFNETKEYVVICKKDNLISIYKNQTTSQNLTYSSANIEKFKCNDSYNFFLYYNNSEKKYHLEYDCYNNNTFITIKSITEPKKFSGSFLEKYYCYNDKLKSYYYQNFDKPLDALLLNLYDFLEESLYIGRIYELYSENYSLYIRPADETNYPNISDIDFSDCEYYLMKTKTYSSLTLIIFEIKNPDSKSLNNKIEYKLFDENYEEVNLSICEDLNLNISINYSMKYNDTINLNLEKINYYGKNGINLFNINDVFFQELCHEYPYIKFDVIMKDRIDLYIDYYICDEGCSFKEISETFITCSCPFKNYIEVNTTLPIIKPGEIPTKFPKYTEIIKCLRLVFLNSKINNIGFYLITFMLGGHMPIWCYYLSTGVNPITTYITKEMTKYGYLSKRKKSKSIRLSSRRKSKKKEENKENKENNREGQNTVEYPPKKKEKKKSSVMIDKKNNNKEIVNINKEKRCKKKKSNKKSTYIQSCYIINNNNINNKRVRKSGKINSINLKINHKKAKSGKEDQNSKDLMKNSKKSLDINLMETQNINYLYNEEEEINYEDFDFIHIYITPNTKQEPRKESNKILNNYTYEQAIEYDKRSIFKIFYIYLLTKNIIFRTLLLKSPFDTTALLGAALIFVVSNDLFFNCLLYSDKIVSKRYHLKENIYSFTFSTNMPNIFGSLFIVYVIIYLIFFLTNINDKIRSIFQKEEEKLKNDKTYRINENRKKEIQQQIEQIMDSQNKKNYAFFIIEIIIMLIYWYYITAFCHVFSNSQTSWIFNTFFTIVFRYIFDCSFCLLFSLLYLIALDQKSQSLYNIALFFYNL